jgi:hypothetical protein
MSFTDKNVSKMRRFVKGKICTKLHDGKTLGGEGRLTQSEIGKLNNYYDLAIRRNVNSLETMKKAV